MNDLSHTLDDYDYPLPPERIAQFPLAERDSSRLMVLEPEPAEPVHRRFADLLGLLRPNDILVINSTRVFPARLLGRKQTGGKVELFLLTFPRELQAPHSTSEWRHAVVTALIKSSKRPKVGSLLLFSPRLQARVDLLGEDGKAEVTLQYRPEPGQTLLSLMELYGQMPLPPYIDRPQGSLDEDAHRYQTCYAQQTGSVAAPTAGLHFSDALLQRIRAKGVEVADIVLHVGYGTFAPVRSEDIREHVIHREQVEISAKTAASVNRVKAAGGRIWAVGTTTVRTLEYMADTTGRVCAGMAECDLFIYPGYRFRVVDNLITNFHLPKSSLLLLVSALAGRKRMLAAYRQAVDAGYRFFSYGDAMAIITRP